MTVHHRRSARTAPLFAVSAALTILAGCGGDNTITPPPIIEPPLCIVTAVTLAPTTAEVAATRTVTLTPTVTQTNCTNPTIAWISDTPTLATVSNTGVVTGIAPGGPVTITATVEGKSATATITVLPAPVTLVDITPGGAVLQPAATHQLSVVTTDAAGDVVTGREITFASSDESVATVSPDGLVTAVAQGLASITATSEEGSASVNIVTAGPSAGRFGYVWASDASSPAYTPTTAWSYNTSGTPATIARPSQGSYEVTFPGFAKESWSREVVMVSAYGTLNRTCQVGAWDSNGADLVAHVHCFLPDGQPGDSPFTVMVADAGTIDGRFGFALIEPVPSSVPRSPDPRFSGNSSGGAITWTEQAEGRYRVRFAGLSRTAGDNPETMIASAFGDQPRRCNIAVWNNDGTDLIVDVQCRTMTGELVATPFVIMMVDNGRVGQRAGFAWADDPDADSYPINNGYMYSTSGGAITATRTSTGDYAVVFDGLTRSGGGVRESVFVTSYSTNGYCNVREWQIIDSKTTANVACYAIDGTPLDMRFDVLVVE
ncbi:MAG TPA: Ig-like domain-containing protein [Gemmatimonadaceae bacterium]|nr:Ig-like domain-containing protein [Gemmatimonadaceae bacterium]